MNLRVLSKQSESENPWYADGLEFTCTQCGNCCTGGPGFVWITREEIVRLAEYLKLSPEQVVEQYCRKVDGRFSLTERRTKEGLYDCVFLTEVSGDGTSRESEGRGDAGTRGHESDVGVLSASPRPRVSASASEAVPTPDTASGSRRQHGSPRKACSVYPARPLQCRTWPFWSENLRDRKTWDRSAKRCHGMNGGRQFTLEQIQQISESADWPANPPSSR